MIKSIRKKRASITADRLRDDPKTYTEPIDTQDANEDVKSYIESFWLGMHSRQDEFDAILKEYADSVGKLYTELVPKQVTKEEFWLRYFYRCDVARLMKSQRRRSSKRGDRRSSFRRRSSTGSLGKKLSSSFRRMSSKRSSRRLSGTSASVSPSMADEESSIASSQYPGSVPNDLYSLLHGLDAQASDEERAAEEEFLNMAKPSAGKARGAEDVPTLSETIKDMTVAEETEQQTEPSQEETSVSYDDVSDDVSKDSLLTKEITIDTQEQQKGAAKWLNAMLLASLVGVMAAILFRTFEAQLPAVELPSVELPSVEMPTLPSIELPSVELPSFNMPSIELPSVEMPSFELPSVSFPSVDMPSFELPSVEMPSFELPSVEMPSFELPSVEMPSFELPSVEVPSLSLDGACSPAMPGTELGDEPASFEAPWWAPSAAKPAAFRAVCGDRKRTKLDWDTRKLSVSDAEDGSVLLRKRYNTNVAVNSDRFELMGQNGVSVDAPWVL